MSVKNRTSKPLQLFCACCLWPWLGRSLTTTVRRYILPVLWMTYVMFWLNGQAPHGRRKGEYAQSNSPGGSIGPGVKSDVTDIYDCPVVGHKMRPSCTAVKVTMNGTR